MRKSIALLCAMLVVLGLLAGCGAAEQVTAPSLVEEAQKYTDDADSMKTKMVLNMAMSGESLQSIGGSVEIGMDMDMDSVKEPMANHMTGKVNAMGMDMDYEAYTVLEDKELCVYSKMLGSWTVQKTPVDEEALENLKKNSTSQIFSKEENFTLQDETEDVNGTEAYIITGTIEGDEIKDLMASFSSAMPSMGMDLSNADYSGVSVDVKYAIAKEERKPVYVDMTFKGMESMMGESAAGVTIDNFTIRMDYLEFNTVDKIEIPQEVIDNAKEAEAPLTN